jgi:hypothetical protein
MHFGGTRQQALIHLLQCGLLCAGVAQRTYFLSFLNSDSHENQTDTFPNRFFN